MSVHRGGIGISRRRGPWIAGGLLLLFLVPGLVAGCGSSGDRTGFLGAIPRAGALFRVLNTWGAPVPGATVFLVPAQDVSDASITGQDILDGASEDRDEPLEDAVTRNAGLYPQAGTGPDGYALIQHVPDGRWFWFVRPGGADPEHLPGGSGCRRAREATSLWGQYFEIVLSTQPGPQSDYVGSSACLACHAQYATFREHAHRLGFSVPGQFAPLQDPVRYPDFTGGWAYFLSAASYLGGTPVYHSDFDPGRGFDKFKTSLSDPRPAEILYAIAWLWRDTGDGQFKITLENVINPADPMSPWTLTVALTYGGAVYKQRNLVSVPGRKGHYPLLQWQSEGDESRYDRTRKVFRDYHLDFFWDAGAQQFKLPATNRAFEGNCTGCHSTGFRRFQDPVTLEWLSDAVDDPAGAFDIDGDSDPEEINLGCEVCHGPGRDHFQWAQSPQGAGREARYIVVPEYLSPSREMMICGRCHGREKGVAPVVTDEPLNLAGEMPRVGISRAEYLDMHTSRKGPALSSYWSDGQHSKSHHQQYTDLLRSRKHRNDRYLVTCSDCHDSHGYAQFRHHLDEDPDDPQSLLCWNCHIADLTSHSLATVGYDHDFAPTTCVRCHLPQTAKTGAGRYGRFRGSVPPSGGPGDVNIVYYENDISSHLFVVPRKTHPDVAGATPSSAMPIPYTNSCGLCHFLNTLKPEAR